MAKLTLNTIGSRYGSIDSLNDNFDAIEQALENTLSRDGTSPNAMEADLDLNDNDLLNVGVTNTQTLYINGIEVEPSTGVTAGSAFQTYSFTATAAQTTFSVAPYTPLVSSIVVIVNGLELPPADVSVSTTNVVIPACTVGDEVVIRRFTKEPTVYPTAATQDFQQAGAGAQVRTVQSKLRDVVSVLDFGAVGDGVTDDTAEIQAALNCGAKTVHLRSDGMYLVSSTMTVPAGITVEGNGATIVATTHFKVLDFANGGGVFNLRMTGPGGGSYVAGSIAIGCSGTNNAPSVPTYVTGPVIENCTISGFGEYGVFLEYIKVARIAGNNITSVGYAGVGGVSCEDVIVDGNVIKNITAGSPGGDAYGVFIDRNNGTSEVAWPRSYRCIISNNLIENVTASAGNNGHAIDTHGGVDFIIDSNKVTNCEGGIYLTASSISGVQELGPIRCVVSNNIISGGFDGYGIIVYGARTGATVAQYAEDCVVSGNVLTGHGWKTSGTVPGVFLSVTKNLIVTNNLLKHCGGSCIMLDFQNITFNISGNEFIDPQSTTYATPSCVLVYSIDNRGYIGGNTYRYENVALATYVAVNSVRIESGLTGLDIDFSRSTFQGIDATHLTFNALTTAGVRYTGLHCLSGSGTIAVSSGVGDGITDVTFSKRFPYAPNVTVTLRRPFNQGGKFPILGVDTTVGISATGFRIYALPYDGATWTATGSLSFDWQAN